MPPTAAATSISGRRSRLRADVVDRDEGREDRAEDHLAFDADVPEPHPERDDRAERPTTSSGAAWTSTAETLIEVEKIETTNSS